MGDVYFLVEVRHDVLVWKVTAHNVENPKTYELIVSDEKMT
jgi:hypothetical protein